MERLCIPRINNVLILILFILLPFLVSGGAGSETISPQKKKSLQANVLSSKTLSIDNPDSLSKEHRKKSSTPPRNHFSQALFEFQEGNFATAKQYLQKAQKEVPELGDYILYYLGRCHEELGEHQQAVSKLLTLLEQFPLTRFSSKVTLKIADHFFFQKNYLSAREYYENSLKKLPKEKAYIFFQIALSFIEEKNCDEAYAYLKKILLNFPVSEYAQLSKTCLEDFEKQSVKSLQFSEGEQIKIIDTLMGKKQYHSALEKIELLQESASKRTIIPDLLYKEAFCNLKLGKKEYALKILDRLPKLYPNSPFAQNSLFLLGNALWNQDKNSEAINIYQKIIKQFNKGPGLDRAWYLIGRVYEQEQNFKKALKCFKKVSRNYKSSRYHSDSIWRVGWIYYQGGKYREAQKYFAKYANTYDHLKHCFLYWQGRSAEKCREPQKAITLYQSILEDFNHSYYTWWALYRLNKCSPLTLSPYQRRYEISRDTIPEEMFFHFTRAEKLLEFNLPEEAREEIALLVKMNHDDPHFWYHLGKMCLKAGAYRQIVTAGYRCYQLLTQNKEPKKKYTEIFQLLYPLAYWDNVQTYAYEQNLDPLLVCSVMRQESFFDPLSLSHAQAYGLMQIIPSTARAIASKMRPFPGGKFELSHLYQPEININFGCRELADLMVKYEGNIVFALIGYNAGENALTRWLNRYSASNLDEFVENISYKETRNYVKKVIKNYGLYLHLYNKSSPNTTPILAKGLTTNRFR